MTDDELFKDCEMVKKITPFAKLRKLRGWTLDKAAEVFAISRATLISIEKGRLDPSKQLVRQMDKVYGCGGRLIEYWLVV